MEPEESTKSNSMVSEKPFLDEYKMQEEPNTVIENEKLCSKDIKKKTFDQPETEPKNALEESKNQKRTFDPY